MINLSIAKPTNLMVKKNMLIFHSYYTLFNYCIQKIARQSHTYSQANLKVNCQKTHTNAFKKSLNYVWVFVCDSNMSKLFKAFLHCLLIFSIYLLFIQFTDEKLRMMQEHTVYTEVIH